MRFENMNRIPAPQDDRFMGLNWCMKLSLHAVRETQAMTIPLRFFGIVVPRGDQATSGAKAPTNFQRLGGPSELGPFPVLPSSSIATSPMICRPD